MALKSTKDFTLKGVQQVMANLNKALEGTKQASFKGLIKCAILVQRSMDKESPKVPVDLRNLQHSWFAVTVKNTIQGAGAFKGEDSIQLAVDHSDTLQEAKTITETKSNPVMIFGFTANYAAFVHELGDDASFQRPGAGAKFFESALNRNYAKMLSTLQQEAILK
jgi:hypothetical protein